MPRSIILPSAFIALLVVLGGGIWLYQTLSTPTDGATSTRSGGFFGSLFPFGSGARTIQNPDTIGENGGDITAPIPTLRHITEKEVAGSTFATGAGGEPVLRYIERETGHIYETPLNAWTATRLTNTTVPAVSDAVWINASTTVLRFLADDGGAENFVGFFSSTTPDQSLQGTFIGDYTRFAIGAGGAAIVGIVENGEGSILEVTDSTGNKPKAILASPLRSWVPVTAGNTTYLATAPSSGLNGTLFRVRDDGMNQVASEIAGLEALGSPSGKKILLSGGAVRILTLDVLDTETGAVTPLARATLVSKCAWVGTTDIVLCAIPRTLPLARYPDDWHLGRVHTDDELWFINTASGVATVATTFESGVVFDIEKLVVNSTGTYAAFIDRMTESLWLTELGSPQ